MPVPDDDGDEDPGVVGEALTELDKTECRDLVMRHFGWSDEKFERTWATFVAMKQSKTLN